MNNQEIFDKVSVHLLTQGVQAMDIGGSSCRYRTNHEKPLKCSIGCLIPDDIYTSKIEGLSLKGFEESYSYISSEKRKIFKDILETSGLEENNYPILVELQCLHDVFYPKEWKQSLISLADRYSVSTSVMESL